MTQKVIIVGAGPIGCYAAQILKSYGYDPLLIEEHSEVGRPLHCTGLVGQRIFQEKRPLNFKLPSASIKNIINGAIFHYDGEHFSVQRQKVAYVIDRERFDKELSRGLDIVYENKFLGLEKNNSGYVVETDKDEFRADVVVGADGANSTLRKILNPDTDNISPYKGVQLRIKIKSRYKDFVEVYLRKPALLWIVPEAQDIIRVGAISENPHCDLQNFLKETKIKGDILDRFGGVVVVGICATTARDNIALVGDAACQMKPLTYGGLYFGLKAADILVECIKKGHITDYDRIWKKEFVSEIKIGLKIKQIYNRLEHKEFKEIFKLLKTQKSLIEKIGDFENHSRLFLEIIKKPSLYPQIGSFFSMLFKKII